MVDERTVALRWIVTGPRRAGKTTFCRHMADLARSAGWDLAGVLSLPCFEGASKVAIRALDLRSGDSRLLASNRPGDGEGFQFCNWHFDAAALDWVNGVLQNAPPCDLLIVDEIGALELKAGGGFAAVLPILAGGGYHCAVVAVRMDLEADLRARWSGSSSVHVRAPEDAVAQAEALFARLSSFQP